MMEGLAVPVPCSSTEKKEFLGNSIYLTEGEKCEQTTVAFRKPQVEEKTTQVTINSSSLNHIAKPIQQTAQNRENPRRKESLTLQVVRLARYRSNFSSSNRNKKKFPRYAVFLPHDSRRSGSSR